MRFKLPKRKNCFRWLLAFIGAAACILYFIIPFAFGVAATLPQDETVDPPPQGYREITLPTRDNIRLAGWYKAPANGAVIIIVHGAGGTRDSIRKYAAMVERNGFGVLAFDLRGQGASGGKTNRFGWAGTLDVGAAVEWLRAQPEVEAIGGLGISLGAEVLLGAASTYPELRAIVADGATFRSLAEYHALPQNRSLWRDFTTRVLYFGVALISGDTPPEPPLLDSIRAADQTAFLFIAAGEDATEVEFNERFLEKVGARGRLWVVPGVGHTGGFDRDAAAYAAQVLPFFQDTLRAP